jgi:uncharacterized protein YdeI (YjbR/CyaY-like superfamily)
VVDIGETLYVTDAASWRAWLEANHASKSEIWLVLYTKASGKPSIPYGDSVDEALCFGWIDSVVKKYGREGRVQRFTPRRPGSRLSEMNRERVRRLIARGRMTQAGLDAIGDALDEAFVMAGDIVAALRADEAAWRNFRAFPESYQRIRVAFVEGARSRPAMFKQRLDYLVRMSAQNKRFGMLRD